MKSKKTKKIERPSKINFKLGQDNKILLFSFFIILLAIVSFNFTGITGAATEDNVKDWFISFGEYIFGADLAGPTPAGFVIIYIIIFAMLATAFSDVIYMASAFRHHTAWVLGIGLAVIAVLTGVIRTIAYVLLSIVAGYGTVTVSVVLILAFTAFLVVHTKLGYLIDSIRNAKLRRERNLNIERVVAATKEQKKVGAELERPEEESIWESLGFGK